MTYLDEILGFYDYLQLNKLSTGQIALWHALMAVNNKCGWKEWFTAPNRTLELYTALSRQSIVNCRNTLAQKGLIQFKTNGTKASIYKMVSMADILQRSLQTSLQDSLHGTLQDSLQRSLPFIEKKRQEEKREKTDRPCAPASGDGVAAVANHYQQLTGNCVSPNMYDGLCGYIGDGVEPELICALLDYAAEKKVNNLWRYTEKAIMGNMDKGIYTLAAYRGGQEKRKEPPKQMENASAYEDVTDRIMREWRGD